ncbi:transposase [Mycobacterium sp. 1165196.3]|uniref:TetR/AcrR family transcriptional regulator n=1 Tax=unclassified Mycobacterium TaxID=2642494 RepID=UPI0008020359|nr:MULTISPECIES: TetR/AcrR family transcriptional regulator [unclassified Mycobacterium]OBK05685.1 transposase [Mycobacterium sp. 1245852.3]OBK29486.1 transposase [Mycobacterium sp. 1165196.3]
MTKPRSHAERTRATIDQILTAARRSFAEDGFDNTSLDAVVENAGVTKGALYHHFDGKRAVFAAVYEGEQRAIGHTVLAKASARNSWRNLLQGCQAFFDAISDPGVQRITLIDAPAVLGWQHMRELEDRHVTSLLREGLRQAIADGHLKPQRVDPLAHLIHGAMCEAAMHVARAADPAREAKENMAALRDLLNGIAVETGN